MEWHEAVDSLRPQIVRIFTPQGTGTGFLLTRSADGQFLGLATAAHVVNQAHYWEQPVRIQAAASGETVVLRQPERAIIVDEPRDTAIIILKNEGLLLPEIPIELINPGYFLKVGNPIGWLGFPAIYGANLCFFAGTTSAYDEGSHAYFVDGVAINGVSGGPAFALHNDLPEVIGVVSAYAPNRATGETLPGLCIVRDVSQFHEFIAELRSLEEAQERETAPNEPPPPHPAPGPEVKSSAHWPT